MAEWGRGPGSDGWFDDESGEQRELPPSPPPTPSRGHFQPRTGSRYAVRRAGALILVLAVIAAGVWWFSIRDESPSVAEPATVAELELHGWAPYWTLEHSGDELRKRAQYFDEISPFWFRATGVESIEADPSASDEATAEFIRTARRSGVPVVPSIIDSLGAGEMATILSNEDQRRRHVDAISRFVEKGDYDGVDIDYEQFAFADGRDTWESTRPNWVRFVDELSSALHEADKTLTVSIPPVFDGERTDASGYWVYDYAAITPMVDHIRVMAYDYSTTEPGPIAPLDWVRRAAEGTAEVSGDPSKLVLGLPIYGYNWPVATRGTCPDNNPNTERTTVNLRTLDDLLDRRSAEPRFDEETGESRFEYTLKIGKGDASCWQTRRVHYVDADGVDLRADIARQNGFGGVALWAFGFEDASIWNVVVIALTRGND